MERVNGAISISDLPEGCVSAIVALTSPLDACRASAVCHGFKTAADSDAVWERFLPPDYREIIARAVSDVPVVFHSKKQLYFYLSDSHILLDHVNLSIMLDKQSGKKCYMLGARELSIAWHEDPRYWEWGPIPESRFPEVGILEAVWWLAIHGKMATSMLSQNTTYAAYLIFRVATDSSGLDVPAKTKVRFGGTEIETSDVYLKTPEAVPDRRLRGRRVPIGENNRLPRQRKDGWMEVELGEFYYDGEDDGGEVEMGFEETLRLNWKHGLIVEGIELKPKCF